MEFLILADPSALNVHVCERLTLNKSPWCILYTTPTRRLITSPQKMLLFPSPHVSYGQSVFYRRKQRRLRRLFQIEIYVALDDLWSRSFSTELVLAKYGEVYPLNSASHPFARSINTFLKRCQLVLLSE